MSSHPSYHRLVEASQSVASIGNPTAARTALQLLITTDLPRAIDPLAGEAEMLWSLMKIEIAALFTED